MNIPTIPTRRDIIGGSRRIALGVFGAVLISVTSGVGASATEEPLAGTAYATDHVLVKVAPGAEMEGVLVQKEEGFLGEWRRVAVPEGRTAEETVEELQTTDGVETASIDPIVQLDPMSSPVPLGHVPSLGVNDPLAEYQWHLPAIQTQFAWGDSSGTGVVVAVVDTGISRGGEDLDCHSFVDPYNAITGAPGLSAVDDDHGHGTHVAGTVAQCTNNGVGVAGVAFDGSLMPVKVLNSSGMGFISDIAVGIDWARAHGADVINLSLGCFGCSNPMIDEAIDAAIADGVVIVAAAGNGGSNSIFYPASHPDVIGVGATDYSNTRAPYSNRGQALDLVAPGGDLDQDANGDGYPDGVLQETFDASEVWDYYFMGGTSMATAHVSGAVALLLERFPEVDCVAVKDVLAETAFDLGPSGHDTSYGHGLVQIHEALTRDTARPTWPSMAELVVDRFADATLDVSWIEATDNWAVTGYLLRVDGETWTSQSGRQSTITGLTPGTTYQMEVIARDVMGNWSQPLRARVGTSRAFADTPGNVFYHDILWMSGMDITRGCNPPRNDQFCPDDPVTRSQIAAFFVRALGLDDDSHPGFKDVPGNATFASDISKLATAGVTQGCNPPANDMFCPEDPVTRAQAAAFLAQALGLSENEHAGFADVPANAMFADDIGKLATAGITRGCNPPDNDRFCPEDPLTRGQFAALLHRAWKTRAFNGR
ncbi:MAG TPA: S8 family serine peptidase [Acidimicrobiia bacterium]